MLGGCIVGERYLLVHDGTVPFYNKREPLFTEAAL